MDEEDSSRHESLLEWLFFKKENICFGKRIPMIRQEATKTEIDLNRNLSDIAAIWRGEGQ